jgi:Flp pilus assembly protein TadG
MAARQKTQRTRGARGASAVEFALVVPKRRARRDDRGVAAVEFALVLPLLVILAFAIIQFGIVFAQQLALSNAARQTARFGVVADRTCADIIAEAKSDATAMGMDGNSATVSVKLGTTEKCGGAGTVKPCLGSTPGSSINVTVGYTTSLMIPLVVQNNSLGLQGKGSFRCEFS